jgi:hypothetical protein
MELTVATKQKIQSSTALLHIKHPPPLFVQVHMAQTTDVGNFRDMTRATKFQKKFQLPPNFSEVLKDFTREV